VPLEIDILTLFPEMLAGPLAASIPGRIQQEGLASIRIHDLRAWGRESVLSVTCLRFATLFGVSRRMRYELRDYQHDAALEVLKRVRRGRRGPRLACVPAPPVGCASKNACKSESRYRIEKPFSFLQRGPEPPPRCRRRTLTKR